MKAPHDVPEEADLRELFDASIEPTAGPTLTKLAARAQDIPEQVQRSRRWVPRWVWAPAAAGVGAVVIALSWSGTPTSESLAVPAANPHVASAVASEAEAEKLQPADLYLREAADVPPTLNAMAELDTDWDPESEADGDVSLGALQGPPADADLDAWLFATATVLQEGS